MNPSRYVTVITTPRPLRREESTDPQLAPFGSMYVPGWIPRSHRRSIRVERNMRGDQMTPALCNDSAAARIDATGRHGYARGRSGGRAQASPLTRMPPPARSTLFDVYRAPAEYMCNNTVAASAYDVTRGRGAAAERMHRAARGGSSVPLGH